MVLPPVGLALRDVLLTSDEYLGHGPGLADAEVVGHRLDRLNATASNWECGTPTSSGGTGSEAG